MKQYRIQRAAGRQQGPVTKLQIILKGVLTNFLLREKLHKSLQHSVQNTKATYFSIAIP